MRGLSLLIALVGSSAAHAESASFRNDVMAVLSRAGCNQGACHGNLNGKGGLKLSLRGEDPLFDLTTLTRDMQGRRVDPMHPAESLLLRKAVGLVPHEGGPRFSLDSTEYRALHSWIASGCRDDAPSKVVRLDVAPRERILFHPENQVRLSARATFADGSSRDVTHLCAFDTTVADAVHVSSDGLVTKKRDAELHVIVRYLNLQVPVTLAFLPVRKDYVQRPLESTNPVDLHLARQWHDLRLTPSPIADDSTFIRRLYLDLLGVLPSSAEARTFLDDPSVDKRRRLIDEALRRPEFADYWAQKWGDLLRNEEKSLDRKGVRVFHQWIRDSIDSGRPLNEFARDLISATGNTYQNPPANLYRSLREPYARAESIAQVFLGIRLQCAKCHNHPFDRWTQDDYHEFAAFFGRIDYRVLENSRRDQLDKHEFNGEQIVFVAREGGLKHPRSGEVMKPRLLGSSTYSTHDDPLGTVADWVAGRKNPFFARAQVNRIWLHLFGRGLVEPNDDFRETNPAANGPLLDDLTKRFIDGGLDLRSMVRLIVSSHAYQRSSVPAETNGDDETHFSRAIVQPLEAEQLFDAVGLVTGTSPKFDGYPVGTRAGQMAALPQERRSRRGLNAERFLKAFGKPDRLLTCECERNEDMGLVQAFQLLTGETLQEMLSEKGNRIGSLMASGQANQAIIEDLYLAALSRRPSTMEAERLVRFVEKAADRRSALEDVAWGLINSKEFLLRK